MSNESSSVERRSLGILEARHANRAAAFEDEESGSGSI